MRSGWVRGAGLAVALAASLAATACGRGGETGDDPRVAEAAAFMEENARAEGVTTLESGLQYKVLTSGEDGARSPDGNDLVRVHYEGTLINGDLFDSSFERGTPYVTTPEQVVPGWTEALQRMKVGDEWMLYVPPELGYGARGGGARIPPHSVLVFRIQLLDVAPIPGGGVIGRG